MPKSITDTSETNNTNPLITLDTPVTMYSSINYLPPYLRKQKLMQDLCFFFDYLGVDIEAAYNDLRYKYIDWNKISETGAIQTLKGMGMDYIVDLIEAITPSNSNQLLALCSVIWLLKGQLLGVDIIASVCGFTYTVEVWHEQVPLAEPNTAVITIDFVQYRALTEDFQHNFVEFLRKYLYPVITAKVVASPMEGELYTYGFMYGMQRCEFKEFMIPTEKTYDCIENTFNPVGSCYRCHGTRYAIKLDTVQLWETIPETWSNTGYYATNNVWGAKTLENAFYLSPIYDTGALYLFRHINLDFNYYTSDPAQDAKAYCRYSEDNIDWSDWVLITDLYQPGFRYCQFRADFNNTNGVQMLLYSFKVTLS